MEGWRCSAYEDRLLTADSGGDIVVLPYQTFSYCNHIHLNLRFKLDIFTSLTHFLEHLQQIPSYSSSQRLITKAPPSASPSWLHPSPWAVVPTRSPSICSSSCPSKNRPRYSTGSGRTIRISRLRSRACSSPARRGWARRIYRKV